MQALLFQSKKMRLNKKWKIFLIESCFSFFSFFSFWTSFTMPSIWRIGSRCHAPFSLKVGGRYIEDIHMNCMTTNCPKWSWNEREMNDPSCPSNVSLKKSLKFIFFYQTKCKRSLGLFPAPLCSPLFPNTKENSCTITCLMHIKPQIYEHISTTRSSR